MPRIRSLKPEHKTHRKVGPLDHVTYRLWVGLVTEADDDGRLVADPAQLRALIFPYHQAVTLTQIETGLHTLAAAGLLRRYAVNGTPYAAFPSWTDHQKIDRSRKSLLPPCPESSGVLVEPSTNVRRALDESSSLIKDQGSRIKEGNGSEGGLGGTQEPQTPPAPRPVFKIAEPIQEALNRAPRLGAEKRLRTPAFWQAEVRANPGVDFPAQILKAEAWLVSHPERPKKKLTAFFHNWLNGSEREE